MTIMRPLLLAALLSAATAAPAQKQTAPPPAPSAPSGPMDPEARIAAQREAMAALAFLDGAWRGGAETQSPPQGFIQTERVGTMLGGTVRVIEGHGRDGTGKTVFNALGIVSFDPAKRSYSLRSYAMGFVGDYPLTVRSDGFSWGHPMGPGVEMRYTATVKNGEWHEVGHRIAGTAPPVRVFEMRLRRLGSTGWPQEGAVPMR
jgi:hypothetical protein